LFVLREDGEQERDPGLEDPLLDDGGSPRSLVNRAFKGFSLYSGGITVHDSLFRVGLHE
jgi:hypothetical protein